MREPNLAFNEAAAQLIPILFGVFLAERYPVARAGQKPLEQAISLVQACALLAIFVAGEVVTLNVLATGQPTDAKFSFVATSLAVGGALILIGFVRGYAHGLSASAGTLTEWLIVLGLFAVVRVIVL